MLSTPSPWWVSADAEEEDEDDDDDDDDDAGEGTLGMETGLAWARAPLYWEKGQERTTALLLSSWPVLCWPVRIFITEPRPLMVEPAPTHHLICCCLQPDLPTIDFYDLNIMTTFFSLHLKYSIFK